jgi:hypothetical protein
VARNLLLVAGPRLASGDFLASQRNAVLIGGTGTGKSHLLLLRLPAPAFVVAPAAAPTMLSIWSIAWKPNPAPDDRDGLPTTSHASTSSFSTNLVICLSQAGGQLLS